MKNGKIKVFALFRNNVSYIDPLLEKFNENGLIDLKVAFSVNKPSDKSHLEKIDYEFLSGADRKDFFESGDYRIRQNDVVNVISEFSPDVMLIATSYYSPTTWMALGYAKKHNIPGVTRMTVESSRKRKWYVKLLKGIIVSSYCRRVDAGVYECNNQKNYMMHYGIPEKKLFFAPCSVDNDYFYGLKNSLDRELVRRSIGAEDDCCVIAFTGQLIDRKRPMDILEAGNTLLKEGKRTKIVFMGDGILREKMESYIDDHEMKDSVILTGKLDQKKMSEYLTASDVYVLPSENDASPKALNEAMNFELPIVITDGIETASEMCREGENGYVVHVGDIDAITDSLRKIINTGPSKMGAVSRRIVSEYSYERVVNSWIDAIQSCL